MGVQILRPGRRVHTVGIPRVLHVVSAGVRMAAFITRWKTDNVGTSNDDQITLPLPSVASAYDFVVYWGDGENDTITAYDDAAVTHTYDTAGTYTVTIIGKLTQWKFDDGGDKLKILEVTQWGTDPAYAAYIGAWYGCMNVVFSATDVPNTSAVTSFAHAWRDCSSLTSFPLLDASLVTASPHAWRGCSGLTSFPPLDTSKGTSFFAAWHGCSGLTSFPLLDVSSGETFGYAWYTCSGLTSFPALDMGACTILASSWTNCPNIASFLATGMNADFALPCDLDAAALDVVYGNLADRSAVASQDIDVTGNPGISGDDPTIATAKNWTVTGS